MPRAPKFSDDDVLDAALACVGRSGREVSVQDVAAELEGPVGSIYHRFRSREELLVRLWLRSVRRFQAGVFELDSGTDVADVLLDMAEYVPRYCRTHLAEARALTLYRQAALLADCPPGLEHDVATLNDELMTRTRDLTRRRFGTADRAHLELVGVATRTLPYGLVRPYLGADVPKLIDRATRASAAAVLALGD